MFRIQGSGLRVCRGLGFRVQSLGWLGCLDLKDYGSGFIGLRA